MPPGHVLGALIRRIPLKAEYSRRGDVSVGQVLAQSRSPIGERQTFPVHTTSIDSNIIAATI